MKNKSTYNIRYLLRIPSYLICLLGIFFLLAPLSYAAHDFSGFIAAETTFFPNSPIFGKQRDQVLSLSLQPEYYYEWSSGSSFTAVPFLRLDSADSERTHFDIRELNFLFLHDNWEMRAGIGKVFWGVTEFVHLVDIVNQSDMVESLDGEEKLGQPMIMVSIPGDFGIADFFVLPWFRERTFTGEKGRLRNGLVVDTDTTQYEDNDKEHHIDLAFRYSFTLGDWDIGVHYFHGTDREPLLLPSMNQAGIFFLTPFYHQIEQTGADLQLVAGEWLWKLETFYRAGNYDNYFSATGGFEYTWTAIAETSMDIGFITEMAYDRRKDEATTIFANDALFGIRLSVNDAASTELLGGMSLDLDTGAKVFSIEASTRLGDNYKLTLKGNTFSSLSPDDLIYSLREDDYLQIKLAYYF